MEESSWRCNDSPRALHFCDGTGSAIPVEFRVEACTTPEKCQPNLGYWAQHCLQMPIKSLMKWRESCPPAFALSNIFLFFWPWWPSLSSTKAKKNHLFSWLSLSSMPGSQCQFHHTVCTTSKFYIENWFWTDPMKDCMICIFDACSGSYCLECFKVFLIICALTARENHQVFCQPLLPTLCCCPVWLNILLQMEQKPCKQKDKINSKQPILKLSPKTTGLIQYLCPSFCRLVSQQCWAACSMAFQLCRCLPQCLQWHPHPAALQLHNCLGRTSK